MIAKRRKIATLSALSFRYKFRNHLQDLVDQYKALGYSPSAGILVSGTKVKCEDMRLVKDNGLTFLLRVELDARRRQAEDAGDMLRFSLTAAAVEIHFAKYELMQQTKSR